MDKIDSSSPVGRLCRFIVFPVGRLSHFPGISAEIIN